MDKTTLRRKKKMTFSEKGASIIIGLSFLFLAVIIFYGWLVLDRPEVASLAGVFGVIIGGSWIIFELKAKAENTIMLAKLDKENMYQNQKYEEEEI